MSLVISAQRLCSLAVLAVAALLGAPSAAMAADDFQAVVVAGRYEVDPRTAAPDILLSLAAIERALRGETTLGSKGVAVTLARGARVALADRLGKAATFGYEGFVLRRATLNRIEPSAHGTAGRRLMGVLHFANAAGLRADTAFLIDYLGTDKALTIHELQAMAVTLPDLRVVVRALPLKAGQALMERRPQTIEALLAQTLAARKPLPQARDEWMLMALSPDRVLPGDQLEIRLGDQAVAMPVSFDAQGFPVAALPWKATGKPATANIYLHTDMHPDKRDGRRLVGSTVLTEGKP